jgi:hypothetical protein
MKANLKALEHREDTKMKNTIMSVLLIWSALYTLPSSQVYAQIPTLELDSDPAVEFVVTDPLGRKTGYDFVLDQTYSEIPHARYGYEGIEGEDRYLPQFITGPSGPPVDGLYLVRVVGVESASFSLGYSIDREGTLSRQYVKESTAPGKVLYYQFIYSSNPGVPITLAKVPATNQVSGGIFHVGGGTLSVKAKPSVNFTSGTLNTLVATFRWLTSYGITLSNPTSPTYGFAKWDSVILIGDYSYQKFRAVGSVPINWEADVEYELFTTNVSGGVGTGDFELTNAIPGGEWFVDINYSDKSDTLFYHPLATETPLPIQLYYFYAMVLTNNWVQLNWGTLSETNNYGFFVQKSRSATTGFSDIPNSFVPGHGTTLEPQHYSWIDQNTSSGIWYYRLKQVDLDATFHYTDPVQVYVPEGEVEVENLVVTNSNQRRVTLGWSTRRETNNNRFEVQVSRNDSLHFRTIPRSAVPGHGTTNMPHVYSYTDRRPTIGIWYFRLKQFNEGGRSRYTNMIRVDVR